jgi:FkbM family methyltransferase
MPWRQSVKRFLINRGLLLRRVREGDVQHRDPFEYMRQLSTSMDPLIFDVGANVGQSIERFRSIFSQPSIHAFEPGAETFKMLHERMGGLQNVFLTNAALGARSGSVLFKQNTESQLSSIREPGPDSWGSVVGSSEIQMQTIDDYCSRMNIEKIDILKSDTQGFELEVLKGAERLLPNIRLIYMEVIFSRIDEGLPRFDEMYAYLADRQFIPVSFYEPRYQRGFISWMDALFMNARMLQR